MRGASGADGRARLRNLSAYGEADALRSADGRDNDGDISQEEILDLIVAATLAQDDPLDDEPADGDYWDPDDAGCVSASGADRARTTAAGAGPGNVSPGWGFASDGALDELAPGSVLAGLADTAHGSGLRLVNDDELTGIIRAWRRLTSWATARELAGIAELARRRPADEIDTPGFQIKARLRAAGSAEEDSARGSGAGGQSSERCADEAPGPDQGFPELISPFVSDELAAALTLTARAAEAHLEFATELASKLHMTAAALEAGVIDPVRARIIVDATHVLTNEHAALVETLILPRAGQQTSGQLRAALARAILAADPDAARRRREEAQRDARVMRWREDTGTAALCGRDLPSADALAADQRISARARELKSAGIVGTMDELRARAYLDFLLGRNTLPERDAGPEDDDARDRRAASGRPGIRGTGREATAGPPGGLAARINVTVPLSAILGLSDVPAEVAAFGPVDAQLARDLVRAAGIHPATRWCVTVVGPDGNAAGHGCARGGHAAPVVGNRGTRDGPRGSWSGSGPQHELRAGAKEFMERLGIRLTPLATGTCDHRHEERGYKPSRRLRHLVGARTASCTAPGCRRAAAQCDFDHTAAYDAGGRTCECNLGPLCRRHHRCKQALGWALAQQSPGHMIWTAPSGRRYATSPSSYYV